jgi:hypothetical protein
MVEMSRERGPSLIPTDCLSVYGALNNTTEPTFGRIPCVFLRVEKPMFVFEKLGSTTLFCRDLVVIAKPIWEARVYILCWLWWPRRARLRVVCWPLQVVIEPVYDLSLGEGGDYCWKR